MRRERLVCGVSASHAACAPLMQRERLSFGALSDVWSRESTQNQRWVAWGVMRRERLVYGVFDSHTASRDSSPRTESRGRPRRLRTAPTPETPRAVRGVVARAAGAEIGVRVLRVSERTRSEPSTVDFAARALSERRRAVVRYVASASHLGCCEMFAVAKSTQNQRWVA